MGERVLAGRYEIIEKIGDGGMAVVYKSRDKLLNRFVAVKILRPEYTKDTVFIESFKRESQSAARLSHPNIVNVYDVGQEEDIYYIVMELVDGKTLNEVIDEDGALDYKKTIRISKQIASALSAAHKNNTIHRDVKPHNILIMPDGNAKITDFGIAKAVTDATIVESSNEAIMGSVHYFSPEQARGGYVDEKSDIYSLGIVIYEMLTGKVPFDADNPVTIAVMHMNDKPAAPSQIVSSIPPGLEQIVIKAIEKYQINRFKTADDMYEALDNVDFVTGIIENPEVMEKLRQRQDETTPEGGFEDNGEDGEESKDREKVAVKKEKSVKGVKKVWLVRGLAILLALICAIPVSFFIQAAIREITSLQQPVEEVEVPGLVGLSEAEAIKKLNELDLKLDVAERLSSTEFQEGTIMSQERLEGSTVKVGFTVRVTVSKGAPVEALPHSGGQNINAAKTIPYLLGKKYDDAVYTIEMYGYTVGDISYRQDRIEAGTIIAQTPDSGTEADSGTKINIVISEGMPEIEMVSMPDLMGLTESAARKWLSEAGLTIGAITAEIDVNADAGTVVSQQYSYGVQVEKGSKVDIKLSAKPEPSGDLKTVIIPIDFSAAEAEVFTLSVQFQDSLGNSTPIISRETRFKSMGSESLSLSGTGDKCLVYVYFSDVFVMTFGVNFETGVITKMG